MKFWPFTRKRKQIKYVPKEFFPEYRKRRTHTLKSARLADFIFRLTHRFDEAGFVKQDMAEFLRKILSLVEINAKCTPSEELFVGILETACKNESNSVEVESEVSEKPKACSSKNQDYDHLLSVLREQIKDLEGLRQRGELQREDKYFGLIAPSGGSWYNFDIQSYLGCGYAGFSDNGLFEVVCENGNEWTWSNFADLLELGRVYE